eukprot:Platyproteum_vivax@DN11196_c0_g1_i1.p1
MLAGIQKGLLICASLVLFFTLVRGQTDRYDNTPILPLKEWGYVNTNAPATLKVNNPGSLSECACDFTLNKCDLDCCCDPLCSDVQKNTFTCIDELFKRRPENDAQCYNSPIMHRVNSREGFQVFMHELQGIFCVVRNNSPALAYSIAHSEGDETVSSNKINEIKRNVYY